LTAPADEVRYRDLTGTSVQQAKGEIIDETPRELLIKTSREDLTIPIDRLEEVTYDEQPDDWNSATSLEQQGKFDEAIKTLTDMAEDFDEDDNTFLAIAVRARRLELLGRAGLVDANRRQEALQAYAAAESSLSQTRHLYTLSELMGRLALEEGDFPRATTLLQKIGTLGGPGYRERSMRYQGEIALRQEKSAEAIRFFDDVLRSTAEGSIAREERTLARLGKAAAQVQTQSFADAEAGCRSLLADLAKELDVDNAVSASARNTLGDALLGQKKTKEAVLEGYLWVHVLYASEQEEHARALFHLANHFKEIGYPAFGDEMADRLRAMKNSPWSNKLATPGS
jgi:predicted negative regulator of RcsB-dependent stress response